MSWEDINDTDRYGRTKLHIAAEKGQESKLVKLIEEEAEIDLGDDMEKTALHYAATNGHFNVARILLEHGADANAQDENGSTPLLLLRRNHETLISLLIKFGADINACNFEGKSICHIAAEKHSIEFMQTIIANKCNLNLADKKGITPIIAAAKAKNYQLVEFLLSLKNEAGENLIDAGISTNDGKSLQDYYQMQEA